MGITITEKPGIAQVTLAAILLAGSLHTAAAPGEFDVNFKGQVVDSTCTASVDGGRLVEFGRISRSNFTGLGAVGKTVPFTVLFSDCGVGATGAKVYFTGSTALNTIGAADNITGTQTTYAKASGVGVQVWDENSSTPVQLRADDITATTTVDLSGTIKKLTLMAKVVQTTDQGQPSGGRLNTDGTLYVVYD